MQAAEPEIDSDTGLAPRDQIRPAEAEVVAVAVAEVEQAEVVVEVSDLSASR